MFRHRNERGLTLIEIAIALAIAGLLAATVLTGRDQLRSNIQFSQAIDQAVQVLTTARGEATGTVGSTDSSPGNIAGTGTLAGCSTSGTDCAILGKLVRFNGTSIAEVSTVLEDAAPSAGTISKIDYNTYDVTIPWAVTASPTTYVLLYLDSGGQLQVHNFGTTPPAIGASVASLSPTGSTVINLGSPGHSATVTMDSLGDVTRVIH